MKRTATLSMSGLTLAQPIGMSFVAHIVMNSIALKLKLRMVVWRIYILKVQTNIVAGFTHHYSLALCSMASHLIKHF